MRLEKHNFGIQPFGLKISLHLFVIVIPQGQKDETQQKKQRADVGDGTTSDHLVSHWRSRLTLNIVGDHFLFDRESLPSDVHRYLRV